MKKNRMLLAYTLILVIVAALFVWNESQDFNDTQYVIYLRTNDKDSNLPVFSREEAKSRLQDILAKYFSGWTILEAEGGWTDNNGKISHEFTLVIYLSQTNKAKVHEASDELIKTFNQSSILIHENPTRKEFYSGGK